jgi:hypothetical protein
LKENERVCSTWTIYNSRGVTRKVRKTQHQDPEFGRTQGEIKKKACKKVHLAFGE